VTSLNSTAACVLGILDIGPPPPWRDDWSVERGMTGAWVWTTIERSVGGFWSLTRSQVYQELKRLTASQLVVADAASGRFAITDAGREAAREWFTQLALTEPRAEQIRSPIALSVFFGDYLPVELLERVVREHRLRYQRRLDVLNSIAAALDDDQSLPGSTLRRGILSVSGAIEWTNDVLARLRRGRTARRK
jgi:DNA-binding PadR family transcriptional regulator